jgi:hypothetical protein
MVQYGGIRLVGTVVVQVGRLVDELMSSLGSVMMSYSKPVR